MKYILGLLLLLSSILACKKDKQLSPENTNTSSSTTSTGTTTSNTTTGTTGTSFVNFNIFCYGSNSGLLEYGKVYTDTTGRNFTFSVAQFYISGIRFIKKDGSELTGPKVYLLVKPSVTKYVVGNIPDGEYSGIKLDIGIDSITNNTVNPEERPSSDPLSIQSPAMYWLWSPDKYIFLNIEGKTDTTVSKSGTSNYPFSAKIGTDKFRRAISLALPFITSGQEKNIDINAHFEKLFKGLEVRDIQTNTKDNPAVAEKISYNLEHYFLE